MPDLQKKSGFRFILSLFVHQFIILNQVTVSVSLNTMFAQCVLGGTMLQWFNMDAYCEVKTDTLWGLDSAN